MNKFFSLLTLVLFFVNSSFSQSYAQKTFGLKKKLSGNDENGYILFSPMNCDTTYLINKCGQKVHQWTTLSPPSLSSYLTSDGHLIKTGVHSDTSFLTAGGKGGYIEEYDWFGKLLWRYEVFNDSLTQHHDIEIMPNGNILVLAWHHITKTKALDLGRRPENFQQGIAGDQLWGERIIELRPIGKDSAEIVWQWDLFDHIIQDVDSSKPNYGVISEHPELMNINYATNLKTYDWIHANSVAYNAKTDQIIISTHNISEVWVIDHSTTKAEAGTHQGGNSGMGGDIIYRWGNPEAYGWGTKNDRKMFKQHDAHWIPGGYLDSGKIMIFNNGQERDTFYSTVDVFQIPDLSNNAYKMTLPYGPNNFSWTYKDSIPTAFFSIVISGASRLPNGNTLICSGVQGRFFEVTPKKKIVWEYKSPLVGNEISADGSLGNGFVFRCSFYPNTFGAFRNKNLTSKGAIERNSRPYTCNYENVAPKLVRLSPEKDAKKILPNKDLFIEFDETVLKRLAGTIRIFANNTLFETINVTSSNVRANGRFIVINPVKDLPINSKIEVSVTANSFRDSSFNIYAPEIKLTDWFFYTIEKKPEVSRLSPESLQVNVLPNVLPTITYKDNVSKANNGNVSIFVNGSLKETIAIGSNAIQVVDSMVTITPTEAFKPGSFVVIATDSCFIDVYGQKSSPIFYGTWYFTMAASPKMSQLTPAHLSKDISTTSPLIIKFNQNVTLNTGSQIKVYQNKQLFKTISANSSELTLLDSVLTVKPSQSFANGAFIGIEIPSNFVKNDLGIFYEGIDTANWMFKTAGKLSVNERMSNETIVYPQPVIDWLKISSSETIWSLELVDIYGRVNVLKANESSMVDLTNFSSGIYTLVVNQTKLIKLTKI
jgi:hypothetical protein